MNNFKIYLSTFLVFCLSFVLSRFELYIISGIIVILYAVFLYIYYYFQSGHDLIDMRALFSLAWIGGTGLSCLKLSLLQKDWHILTWICFYLAFLCFMRGYEYGSKVIYLFKSRGNNIKRENINTHINYEKGLLFCIRVVTYIVLAAFILEALVLGFLPILSSKPEAYSLFHISGVHYFTVSTVFIIPLSIIYNKLFRPQGKRIIIELIIYSLISVAIPLIIVSRQLLLVTVVVSVVCYLRLYKTLKLRYIVAGGIILVGLYLAISVLRNHGVDYLNSIYQMKNETPILFSQPYIYIANNYDNFNEMVVNISRHSFGIKSFFPVFALTGLKFVLRFPNFPLYTTITELNTTTFIYDAYYDFGVFGVMGLTLIIGFVCSRLRTKKGEKYNPVRYLAEALMAYILMVSFFTPWFSNPTIWFYFIAIIAMGITVKIIARFADERQ